MSKKIWAKILSVWMACFIIGTLIGKINSPDFSEKSYIENYIEKKSKIAFWYSNKYLGNIKGQGNTITRKIDSTKYITGITFDAGRYLYIFIGNTTGVKKINNLKYHPEQANKKLSNAEWGTALTAFGAPSAYTLKDIVPAFKSKNDGAYVLALIGSVLGIGLGYYLGYSENFDPDTDMAQSVLNDSVFWQGIIQRNRFIPLRQFKKDAFK